MKSKLISKLINISLIIAMLIVWFAPRATLAVTALNLITNPSFEDEGADPTIAANWENYWSGGYTRVNTAHSGSWGIALTNADTASTTGAAQRITFNQDELRPIFIGGYVKGDNIVKGDWFGAGMYAEIYLKGVAQPVYQYSIPNSGTFGWRWIGFNTGTNPAVNAPIDYIDIVPILQQSSGTAYFDDITVNEFAPSQGAVTLMFDDGETGTYTEAKKLLARYGYSGSSAVISDQVDEAGFMTQAQVLDLQTSGWEIVSHSVNHEDMTAMTPTQYNNELVNSKSALEGFLGAGKVKDFAYPLGAYNADIIAAAAAAGYQSTRAYEIGDNPLGSFPYDVKVQSVVESTTISDVQSWLTAAKTNSRWTMIVMHTVTERAGDDTYYVSPAHLNHILDAVRDSGLSVLTYDQAVQAYAVAQ